MNGRGPRDAVHLVERAGVVQQRQAFVTAESIGPRLQRTLDLLHALSSGER